MVKPYILVSIYTLIELYYLLVFIEYIDIEYIDIELLFILLLNYFC